MGKFDEAYALARGLMAHDPSNPFRAGYTLGNALIAVAERMKLDVRETAVVADLLVNPLVEAGSLYLASRTPATQMLLAERLEEFGVPKASHL